MRVVLDSNEYIIHLNEKSPLLNKLFANEKITIYVNELITKEVLRNIRETNKGGFYELLLKNNIIANAEKIPLTLFEKYKKLGLKKGDIAIAAFCEHLKAEYLVTENRHFLISLKQDKFGVLRLKDFLKA